MAKENGGWFRRNVNRVARPEEQTEEQAKRAPWVLLAFVGVLVLVAAGVWALRVFVFEPSETAEPTPQPTSSQEPGPVETSTPSADNGCVLNTTNQDISTTPPEAVRWVVDRWAVLPEVEGAGPCVEQDGYRVGFAPTETGAVLAVYHYFVHGIPGSPDEGTRGLLEYGLLDGPLKDSIMQQVTDVENGVEVRIPDSDYRGVELSGYKVSNFDGDTAVIDLLIRNESSAGSLTAKLVWQDNDWRIDPATADGWGSTRSNVRPQDFVSWTPEVNG